MRVEHVTMHHVETYDGPVAKKLLYLFVEEIVLWYDISHTITVSVLLLVLVKMDLTIHIV